MLGVRELLPGVLERMPRGPTILGSRPMPRHMAVGRDRAACPPNTALQLTASREIVRFLKVFYAVRSRQLNANPFGGFHLCMSIIVNPLLCYTSTI